MTETSLASGSSTILETSLISDGHTIVTLRQTEVFFPSKKQEKIFTFATPSRLTDTLLGGISVG
jgi:hypothetical protein